MWIIPIVSSVLYLIGGQGFKAARWFIGLPIFAISILTGHSWYSIFSVLTYWIATSAVSYGEKMWTTKLFGKWVSMGLAGLAMGLASIVVLGAFWGAIQGIVAMVSFLALKWLDDTDRLKNPWQELCRGFFGTIVYFIA